MKIKNSMLVVKDLEKSKAFYWEVLGLRTLSDLGIHAVCKRFSDEGMTMEEISERMGIPLKAVKAYMR